MTHEEILSGKAAIPPNILRTAVPIIVAVLANLGVASALGPAYTGVLAAVIAGIAWQAIAKYGGRIYPRIERVMLLSRYTPMEYKKILAPKGTITEVIEIEPGYEIKDQRTIAEKKADREQAKFDKGQVGR